MIFPDGDTVLSIAFYDYAYVSATAAIFAAIPFVGAYWACLPAVVELWLVKGQGLAALACLIAHMVPAYVVDTAILREIKG